MPLPIAHGLMGASIVAALHPELISRRYAYPLLAGVVLANAPDFDFALVLALHSKAWHRAFTHSIFFAIAVGAFAMAVLGWARVREALAYTLALLSHGLLDYATTKEGGGVDLLWPFSAERMRLGWIGVSELPSRMSAPALLKALLVELISFGLLFAAVLLVRRPRRTPANTTRGAT